MTKSTLLIRFHQKDLLRQWISFQRNNFLWMVFLDKVYLGNHSVTKSGQTLTETFYDEGHTSRHQGYGMPATIVKFERASEG